MIFNYDAFGDRVKREYVKKCSVNDFKLDNNIIRARTKICEYAYCNDWDYFITLTIDREKYDRTDLQKYYRDFAKWINNKNRKYNIKYLLVPELHSDGCSWHLHGLIKGIPADELSLNKNNYLDWKTYSQKFGFCSLDKIRSQERISCYITKYINKSLSDCVKSIGAHLYYCSKGLKLPVTIKKGTTSAKVKPHFKNDYVDIMFFDNCSDISLLI